MKPSFQDLPNGVRLGVARNPNLNSVVAFAGVKVGSRHEPAGLHGAAHFVEHMLFKGTERRPTAKEISELIESRGGDNNAFTDKELTGFHVRMSKHDGAVAVDVVHDMLENALFRARDVEKERPVIREEISMYDNHPDSNVWELSEQRAYAGTGLAHRITGNSSDVGFAPAALRKFFRSHYVPSRTVVMLAGAVGDELVDQARSLFGSMAPRPFGGADDGARPDGLRPGRDFRAGKTDRLHIVVRFPGVPSSHEDARALEILSLALGGYSSARLFQSLREDKGLCYGVGSSLYGYSDTGAVVVSTSLDRPKFVPAMKAVLKEVAAVRRSGLRPEEVENAKTHRRGSQLLELDRPMSVAADAVRQLFTDGSYEDPEAKVEKLMRTGAPAVAEAARAYLDPAKMHVSVVGPAAAKKEVLSALDGLR